MAAGSVGKPSGDIAVFGFYNITWQKGGFSNYKRTLRDDLLAGFQQHNVDVMLLSECGVIELGLGHKFRDLLQQICGPEFSVTCQSRYACIIRSWTRLFVEQLARQRWISSGRRGFG